MQDEIRKIPMIFEGDISTGNITQLDGEDDSSDSSEDSEDNDNDASDDSDIEEVNNHC